MTPWRLSRNLARDRVAQLGIVVYAAVVLLFFASEKSPNGTAAVLAPFSDAAFLAATLMALLWGRRRLPRRREKHFWDLLALAWASLLLVEFIYFFEAGTLFVSASFVTDVLHVLFYLFFALAAELKPHLATPLPRSVDRRWLEASGSLIAVFGLLTYFALVVEPAPLGLSLSFVRGESWSPYPLMRLSLDILLLVRLLFAAATSTGRWPRLYLLLGLAMLAFAVRDGVLLLHLEGHLPTIWLDWRWTAFLTLPGLLVIFAARYRHLRFAEGPEGESFLPRPEGRNEPSRTSPMALYVLIVPGLHLALHPLGLLEQASRGARDAFSLFYLLVVGALAASHQRALDRERRTAIRSLEAEVEERNRVNRELELRQAELERFTYTISHELRAPLVTIHGFSDILEHRLEGLEDPSRSLPRIRQAALDMSRLLTELLELSRVGWVLNRKEGVSLARVAERVKRRLALEGEEEGPRIEVASRIPLVHADEARLEDVVTNLLTNAIKFTPPEERPEIEVGFRPERPDPVFYVSDRGRGIAAADREKVFGLFNRLDHPEIDGTGVGLALVKRIIEKHEGRIWVESEGVGKGATFCFTLPPPGSSGWESP